MAVIMWIIALAKNSLVLLVRPFRIMETMSRVEVFLAKHRYPFFVHSVRTGSPAFRLLKILDQNVVRKVVCNTFEPSSGGMTRFQEEILVSFVGITARFLIWFMRIEPCF